MSDLHKVHASDSTKSVVFIHGVDGDWRTTWTSETGFFWPQVLGAQTGWATFSVGYDAHSSWGGTTMPLEDRAENLLDLICAAPELKSRSLVSVVAHSLGGLVLKSMIKRATERPEVYRSFLDRLGGLVFLGTPHEGSDLANLLEFIGNYVGATVTATELQRNGTALRHLASWYRDHHEKLGLRSIAFLETQALKLGRFRTCLVVDPTSGSLTVNNVRSIPIDADHRSISKPLSGSAQQYQTTLAFLRDCSVTPASLARLPSQYAAVCYRIVEEGLQFLLVRTSSGLWTFPKGRPDPGKAGFETAENEAFEEAGARGEIEREPCHVYLHAKRGKKRFKREKFAVRAYLFRVASTQTPPEPDRDPTWFGLEDAKTALSEGRELIYASSLENTIDAAMAVLAKNRIP